MKRERPIGPAANALQLLAVMVAVTFCAFLVLVLGLVFAAAFRLAVYGLAPVLFLAFVLAPAWLALRHQLEQRRLRQTRRQLEKQWQGARR